MCRDTGYKYITMVSTPKGSGSPGLASADIYGRYRLKDADADGSDKESPIGQ